MQAAQRQRTIGLATPLPDRVRLPVTFDPARLVADLAALDGTDWVQHFVKRNYEGDWSVLPLRHAAGETHPIRMIYSNPSATAFVDGPLFAQTPYLREVTEWFHCPLHCIRLMRLTPGSVIKEHRDHDLAVEHGFARVHIPIQTNDKVTFLLNGTAVPMTSGSCWYLRLDDPHSVINAGQADRVHLVIDCGVDEWLIEQLSAT